MFQGLQQMVRTTTSKSLLNSRALKQCLLIFTFFLKTPWAATATAVQPVAATAKSTFKFPGHPSPCSGGSHLPPCPGPSAKCCWVTQPAANCHTASTSTHRAGNPARNPQSTQRTAWGTGRVQAARIWKRWLSARRQFVNMSCGSWSFPSPDLWLQTVFIKDCLF